MKNEVRVKRYRCWETSLSFFIGLTPKVSLECGHCSHFFTHRFRTEECRKKHLPRVRCPKCHIYNVVPLVVN